MICPRCQLGDLTPGNRCPHCAFVIPAEASAEDAMLKELERVARGELEGDFDIERVLGRGGMSVVFLARESELRRHVALKVLPLQLAFGPDAAERFKREARIAASLDHPHIVPVHRVGSTPRLMWYSMKYVRGASLATVLNRDGPLPLDTTKRLIGTVAGALMSAHDRGIVHRDVKPGNFMIDERGWAWVADFGVAKAFGSVPLTQTGGALGTPGYMAPEQFYGRELDGRADQYALAIVAYECLAGSPPFVAKSLGEYVNQHCHVLPADVRTVAPDVPEHVALALLKALSKQPEDRFPSIVEFAAALGAPRESLSLPPVAAATEMEHSITSPMADRPTTPITLEPRASGAVQPPRLSRPRMIAAAAAVVVLGLVGVIVAPGSDDTPPSSTPVDSSTAPVQEPEPEPEPPPVGTGALIISTAPVGDLSINGRPAGQAYTVTGITLSTGRHVLRVTRAGYFPWVDTIVVEANQTVRRVGIPLRARQ
jgi:serine/threonine protein kinase